MYYQNIHYLNIKEIAALDCLMIILRKDIYWGKLSNKEMDEVIDFQKSFFQLLENNIYGKLHRQV